MGQTVDLDQIEKKTWLAATNQDGLIDLMVGLLLFGMGLPLFVTDWLGPPWRSMALPGLALAVFFLGKWLLVKPRMGVVKFSRERQVKRAKLGVYISIVLVLQVMLLLFMMQGGMASFAEAIGDLAIPIGLGVMGFVVMAMVARLA